MAVFGELRNETITTGLRLGALTEAKRTGKLEGIGTIPLPGSDGAVTASTHEGVTLSEGDLANQFLLFQFSDKPDGPRVLEASQVTPKVACSDERPDVKARVQLASFHVGQGEGIDRNTRATLRVDFGKDDQSNSPLDTVFWSIAAGMKFYSQVRNGPAKAKDLTNDFDGAFSRRPIEIPGGLGRLSFEVVKHEEPKWWKKVFNFLQSGTGEALSTALGFPGITKAAVGLLDQVFERFDKEKHETLFRSRPMTLALSLRAKDEFTGGLPGIELGSLNPGFSLLTRGRDFGTIVDLDPVYMASLGILKPAAVPVDEFLAPDYKDPFSEMTYAVLRVVMAEAQLSFNVGL